MGLTPLQVTPSIPISSQISNFIISNHHSVTIVCWLNPVKTAVFVKFLFPLSWRFGTPWYSMKSPCFLVISYNITIYHIKATFCCFSPMIFALSPILLVAWVGPATFSPGWGWPSDLPGACHSPSRLGNVAGKPPSQLELSMGRCREKHP